ncbi:hypothetical protein CHLNCDRAFT_143093 [Chlorella variabilis]|uniref:Uncharacterized protein n=1 Tax=Chlorella variabilis TaxID=554065 RepID=E1Z9F6_CHLVA|nr:hypothetical protein CHLNCDRAFT_143093 [Chlorella variabilis]EFN57511.1 hypothetical protein CHLNCDRAFT_143093 [Chlorella variabilis]|eukprot:XP_005849613.1 hypothetical protein CHLNCDRAFT_143093 [Chlorella variabilis]
MSSWNYIKTLIQGKMEDPAERDAKWEAHLRGMQAAAASAKANMAHPTKAWGFWRDEKHNGKYEMNADPAISKLPGRRSGASRLSGE